MTLRVVIEQDGRRLGSMFIDGNSVKVHAANAATADRFLETLGEVFNALQGRQRGHLSVMQAAERLAQGRGKHATTHTAPSQGAEYPGDILPGIAAFQQDQARKESAS